MLKFLQRPSSAQNVAKKFRFKKQNENVKPPTFVGGFLQFILLNLITKKDIFPN